MAILCRHHSEMDMCAEFLRKRKLPHPLRRNSSSVFDPAHDSIKVMTLHQKPARSVHRFVVWRPTRSTFGRGSLLKPFA